jgi:hypothetical protein
MTTQSSDFEVVLCYQQYTTLRNVHQGTFQTVLLSFICGETTAWEVSE